jgi:hypothetical protein
MLRQLARFRRWRETRRILANIPNPRARRRREPVWYRAAVQVMVFTNLVTVWLIFCYVIYLWIMFITTY